MMHLFHRADPGEPIGRRRFGEQSLHGSPSVLRFILLSTTTLLALGIAAGLPRLLRLVVVLGRNVPDPNLIEGYLTGVFWAIGLGLTILFWPVPRQHKPDLLVAWLLRCATTLGVMLVFEYQYSAMDAYMYYLTPKLPGYQWSAFKFGFGTENIQRLVWLQSHIFPHSFHATMVAWSMIGMIATYLFYRSAVVLMGHDDRRVFYILALFPSVLFWSSLLGKDPVTFLGMGLYCYGTMSWYRKRLPRYLLVGAIGILIAAYIRSWYGPMMLASLAAFAIRGDAAGSRRGFLMRLAFLLLIGIGLSVAWQHSRYSESFGSADALVETSSSVNQSFARGGSATGGASFGSLADLILYLPIGIFTVLFRPFFGEVRNLFGLISGVENLILLILAALAVKRLNWRHFQQPVFLWAVLFIFMWAAQYGVVASANLGSLVRYRLQILPLFLGLLLYLVYYPGVETAPIGQTNDRSNAGVLSVHRKKHETATGRSRQNAWGHATTQPAPKHITPG